MTNDTFGTGYEDAKYTMDNVATLAKLQCSRQADESTLRKIVQCLASVLFEGTMMNRLRLVSTLDDVAEIVAEHDMYRAHNLGGLYGFDDADGDEQSTEIEWQHGLKYIVSTKRWVRVCFGSAIDAEWVRSVDGRLKRSVFA